MHPYSRPVPGTLYSTENNTSFPISFFLRNSLASHAKGCKSQGIENKFKVTITENIYLVKFKIAQLQNLHYNITYTFPTHYIHMYMTTEQIKIGSCCLLFSKSQSHPKHRSQYEFQIQNGAFIIMKLPFLTKSWSFGGQHNIHCKQLLEGQQ